MNALKWDQQGRRTDDERLPQQQSGGWRHEARLGLGLVLASPPEIRMRIHSLAISNTFLLPVITDYVHWVWLGGLSRVGRRRLDGRLASLMGTDWVRWSSVGHIIIVLLFLLLYTQPGTH